MPDEPKWSLSTIPEVVSKWLAAMSLFSFMLGVIYQTAYWSQFDVNVMSYMGLQDVIRVSIVPLAIIGAATFVSAAMTRILGLELFIALLRPLRSPWKRIFALGILLLVSVAIVLFALWNARQWITVALAFVVGVLMASVTRSALLPIQPAFARILLISTLIVAPVYSWALGFERADRIWMCQGVDLATLPPSILSSIRNTDLHTQFIYLGHVNDHDFFLSGSRTVVFRSEPLATFSYSYESRNSAKKTLRIPFLDPLVPKRSTPGVCPT
jgi:hypothetical protein